MVLYLNCYHHLSLGKTIDVIEMNNQWSRIDLYFVMLVCILNNVVVVVYSH